MESVFLGFQRLTGTTWFYLSFLLAIAVYFRFSRFFSLRNWDLVTLFLITPGLLATTQLDRRMLQILSEARTGSTVITSESWPAWPADLRQQAQYGYVWLLAITGYLLIR